MTVAVEGCCQKLGKVLGRCIFVFLKRRGEEKQLQLKNGVTHFSNVSDSYCSLPWLLFIKKKSWETYTCLHCHIKLWSDYLAVLDFGMKACLIKVLTILFSFFFLQNLLKAASVTQKQMNLVKLHEQSKKNLEEEIHNYKEEALKQRKIIFQLEKERDRYINEASELAQKVWEVSSQAPFFLSDATKNSFQILILLNGFCYGFHSGL